MFDMAFILNGVGESRVDLVIDWFRLAFIEPSYIAWRHPMAESESEGKE